jgi:transposase
VRQADGTIIQESTIAATRQALDQWMQQLPQPWMAGMEATLFTGWIYDHLVSGGAMVKVAHPAMLQAIAAGKKKNDRVDARKIADLLRCDYFPECHMASREIRDRRRALRYRNLLLRQAVQMKNKVSGLLMERVCRTTSRRCIRRSTLPSCYKRRRRRCRHPCRSYCD